MIHSWSTVTRAKMYRLNFFVWCAVIGGSFGHNVRREAPYNEGRNGYNLDYTNYHSEPSQRLFWSGQGSNQVGGTGLWGTLTNKFPFLGTMFGRMELSNQYGAPNRYTALSPQYGAPNQYTAQQLSAQYGVPNEYHAQALSNQYAAPNQYHAQALAAQYSAANQYRSQQQYISPERYQTQFSQAQQFNQQPLYRQRYAPSGRDVALTDDAVIVTPPFVPAAGAIPAPLPPVPQPPQVPIPAPVAPVHPPQDQFAGYNYEKPQHRLELLHK